MSRPARDGETLSDEPMLADELWSDEHEDAIGLACEKLWNGEPPNNPIHCPRPADHPLVLIANRALDAQNAAAAMYVALVKRQAQVAALRAELADARAELKTVVDSVDDALFAMREPMTLGEARKGRAILTSYSVRRAIAAARAASGKDASHD